MTGLMLQIEIFNFSKNYDPENPTLEKKYDKLKMILAFSINFSLLASTADQITLSKIKTNKQTNKRKKQKEETIF